MRRQLRVGIEDLCRFRGDVLSHEDQKRLVEEVIDETLGLGPLEPLLRDPTISDILIDGPERVSIERRGQLEDTNVRFYDEDHLIEIVQRIASKVGRRLDESSPMVDARLADGSRVNAVIRPLALAGALVSIRRFGNRPLEIQDLIARGAMTKEMSRFLMACFRSRLNVVVSGGTGSGKSTLLNVLSGFIPKRERIVTIEDAAELQLDQPRVARMETRPPNLEGKGEITARELLKNSLRMRPDRIIIGECRGVEAFDMLQAMTTGHSGSLTTIHANSARDPFRRLEMLVGMAGFDLPSWLINELIGSAIQIVVHCERLSNGERKVTQITELTGTNGSVIESHDIFSFRKTGVTDDGAVTGVFSATGIRPRCLEQLRVAGSELSHEMFEEKELHPERIDRVAAIV
ncbi:putative conjugal transfer protein/MT3759 [Thalassoglobus neptunius]|uniref:Putative conjugal transfer protein/MT3759 n=1 Tax=Thalassoglobus neptunius TaxID=1938619 RepID=A0A5C5UWA3_9PLAN|nr:CpaF family protein [Thalassoglobus neptunius]TWT30149.1 putative conjugal transfer protein/MT3759 [Thalassoglobus neptunius]